MSRESRLSALRSRRALGILSTHVDTPAAPGPYDPSMGLPTQVVREAPPPIPVPLHIRGLVRRCGRCESYMAAATCDYCSRVTA